MIPTPGDQPEPQEGGGIGLEGNKPLSFFVLHVHPHACTYVVGVNEGDVFAAKVLYTVIHHVHQGRLPLVLPIQPWGGRRAEGVSGSLKARAT